MAAFGAATSMAAVGRRRTIRLGPFLAGGYAMAIVAMVTQPELFGNWYVGSAAGR